MRKWAHLYLWLGLWVTLTHCGAHQTVPISITLPPAFAAEAGISKIVLTVSGDDFSDITAELTPPFGSPPIFGGIDVPIGADRTFSATAVMLGGNDFGFHGETTTDVTDTTTSVPIVMDFINFAEDATDDGLAGDNDNPDLFDVHIARGDCSSVGGKPVESIILQIDLDPDFNTPTVPDLTETLIIAEFDVDEDPGDINDTFIETNKGGVVANFPTGSEFRIEMTVNFPASGADPSIRTEWINAAGNVEFSDATVGRQVFVCLSLADFQSEDPDEIGVFNVLAGNIPGGGGFTANDIAYEGGVMRYDFSFDTSAL